MTSTASNRRDIDGIEEYRMHVSQRYLDLTRKKLELARLPRELANDEQTIDEYSGITKADLEPLLDLWLEGYDFRAQEQHLNQRLPQFRTSIRLTAHEAGGDDTSVRIHFVHRQSSTQDAIPLLFCHDWGSSFIEVAPVIDALCEPITTPTQMQTQFPAFNVVCPSIPGFGYGDPLPDPSDGLLATATVFHKLMIRLRYNQYMVCGSGWGFKIARAVAQHQQQACLALFTTNPSVPEPRLYHHPISWIKFRIARLIGARISWLSFGYVPSDFELRSHAHSKIGSLVSPVDGDLQLSFALADSPTGLLAFMLQMINPMPHAPTAAGQERPRNDSVQMSGSMVQPWSPTDVLTWTMLYWLSGPEVPLRWLRNACRETVPRAAYWRMNSTVPVGISFFRYQGSALRGTRLCPPPWLAAYNHVIWLRRHEAAREIKWPAWEAADGFVLDLRDFVSDLRRNRTFPI